MTLEAILDAYLLMTFLATLTLYRIPIKTRSHCGTWEIVCYCHVYHSRKHKNFTQFSKELSKYKVDAPKNVKLYFLQNYPVTFLNQRFVFNSNQLIVA